MPEYAFFPEEAALADIRRDTMPGFVFRILGSPITAWLGACGGGVSASQRCDRTVVQLASLHQLLFLNCTRLWADISL